MHTISLKTLFYWYLSKNITIVRSQCPLDVKGSDRDKEDTNGMGFGCHKLVDDRIPENVLEPPSWRNEIADIYPFERSLQVTVLSSVSMEFNSIRDQVVCSYLIPDIFFSRLWMRFEVPYIMNRISLSIRMLLILWFFK